MSNIVTDVNKCKYILLNNNSNNNNFYFDIIR